jgi:steroid delta-isomerase-like uncharacterized protein
MGKEDVNKESLRKQIEEVWNKGNLEIIPEVISTDFSMMDLSGVELKGPEGFSQMVTFWRSMFPDLRFTIVDMVAEGDKVAAHVTYTGTFTGPFGDIEPTGKQVNMMEATFYVFKDGKVIGQTIFLDFLSFYQQSGIPIPENQ